MGASQNFNFLALCMRETFRQNDIGFAEKPLGKLRWLALVDGLRNQLQSIGGQQEAEFGAGLRIAPTVFSAVIELNLVMRMLDRSHTYLAAIQFMHQALDKCRFPGT